MREAREEEEKKKHEARNLPPQCRAISRRTPSFQRPEKKGKPLFFLVPTTKLNLSLAISPFFFCYRDEFMYREGLPIIFRADYL